MQQFLVGCLVADATTYGLLVSMVSLHGTLQAHLQGGVYEGHGINIGIHARFVEDGCLYGHDRGLGIRCPFTEIGPHHRVYDAVYQGDTLGVAEHEGGKVGAVDTSVGAVYLCTYGFGQCGP